MVPWPAAEASPGNVVEMQILGSLNQKVWGGPQQPVFCRPLGAHSGLRSAALDARSATLGSRVKMGWPIDLSLNEQKDKKL